MVIILSPHCSFEELIESHLLVSHPSQSTALELLLLESCVQNEHTSLQCEYIFQNYLAQFSQLPGSEKFRICQDMFNRILAAQQTGTLDTKFREHIAPASVVVGGIMGAIGVPVVMGMSAEIAARQARRERVLEEEISGGEAGRGQLHRSRSMNVKRAGGDGNEDDGTHAFKETNSASFDARRPVSSSSARRTMTALPGMLQSSSSVTHFSNKHSALMSFSQPMLQPPSSPFSRMAIARPISPANFTDETIVRTLKGHYYSTQAQFLQCLQDISMRLRLVPKAARQSALRIELSGLDKWLPADVCLANLCRTNDIHDRVVQIVESECTILNSAERVQITPPFPFPFPSSERAQFDKRFRTCC
jgi:phosphatidylinositol 4-kinase B